MAGGIPYRYLAQGLSDPEGALANQYETDETGKPTTEIPGSSLHDYYVRLIGKTGQSLQAGGMLPSQQLPKMPGWSGDTLEQPEAPNYDIQRESGQNAALVKAVRNFTGHTPLTVGGLRRGQKAGEYHTSPASQAAEDMANQPWQLEQERVATANKVHAFRNQYSYLKSQAKTKDEEMIIDQAKTQATGAALNEHTAGQLEISRDAAKERARADAQRATDRGRGLDIQQQNANTREEQGGRRLDQGDTRLGQGARRLDLQGESNRRAQHKADYGTSKEYTKLQHMDGGVARIDDLLDALGKDPDLLGLKNKAFHWGDVRLASKNGERLDQMRNSLLENLTQLQERMGTRGGSKYLEREIGMIGDNHAAATDSLWQLRDRIDMARWGFESAHPGMKERPKVRPLSTPHKPGRPGENERAPAKSGAVYGDMSDEELDAEIARRKAALQ